MQRYLLKRLGQALVALLGMTIVVFFLARLTGDPVYVFLGEYVSREEYREAVRSLGLDKPLAFQYWEFIADAAKGDFGRSIMARRPALEVVWERFPATLQLAAVAALFSALIALPLGVISATRRGSILDKAGTSFAVLGQSTPIFWLGLLLIQLFAVELRLLPASGRGGIQHYILPAFTMGWYVTAGIMRLVRSSMLDVLDSEYVRLARIKGVSEMAVVWKHCLKNAAIPIITFAGVIFVHFLTGSVITETVFAWPGVGRLAVEAVVQRDFPLIQVVIMLFTVIFILGNLVVDILYAYLDPRVRYR